jgi:hypothetical protein
MNNSIEFLQNLIDGGREVVGWPYPSERVRLGWFLDRIEYSIKKWPRKGARSAQYSIYWRNEESTGFIFILHPGRK